MERIVIVTRQTRNNHGLIELLSALFPECEICTVFLDKEDLAVYPKGCLSGSSITDAKGGSHGKHSDPRSQVIAAKALCARTDGGRS